ncbi:MULTISPECIES: DUF3883 domain-containing protein [unclassified Acidovorax]|uniref:DUF3883 domain-containing protein n=1 Tax=unclassified Acidovorax TaxID=2684926 RepID=UPI001C48F508|nr:MULTISPECIES: DUF3883 domain-containing protein [unclassified Acidovorax]MBV7427221.1 DUF3883 domain-containing protein [Acidovorax sp. sif0732]MBV7448345.1 DUF3883 domain-containing protein [Acidovorax sp. sif0715]
MYLSQGVDYVGFLNAKLRDLEGWPALLNELIQNADDASEATRIVLDLTDTALVVSNDARFSDCGSVAELRCVWDSVADGRKCCDFHAFRRVASGHKRHEEGTTGAFGIGFISVYQITDHPDLRSGNWHWRLDPSAAEDRRIQAESLAVPHTGTTFTLPWAFEQTLLRAALGRAPVQPNVVEQVFVPLRTALYQAAPFLKRLRVLELRINGKLRSKVECDRDKDKDEILVVHDGKAQVWKRLSANFDVQATQLRLLHGNRIETKRKSTVTLAVPLDEAPAHGLLYASLPSEQRIALPVLINADFFPSTSRKHILFNQDYQGDWNRAAVKAGAAALARALPQLRDAIPSASLWALLGKCRAMYDTPVDSSFKAFWDLAKSVVQEGQMVRTSVGRFCSPKVARLNGASKEAAECLPLFEALGMNMVHQDLRPHRNLLLEVGAADLDLGTLTLALQKAGLTEPRALQDVPIWLRRAEHRQTLSVIVDELLARIAKDRAAAARGQLLDCSLWVTQRGQLAPGSHLWRTEAATRLLVEAFDGDDVWAADANPPELLKLVDTFDLKGMVLMLEQAGTARIGATHQAQADWLPQLLAWIDGRHGAIEQQPALRMRLRALAIWPSGGTLRPLLGLSVPGHFDDPLKLAQLLDGSIGENFHRLLVHQLGAKPLDLRTYLLDHVCPAIRGEARPTAETRRQLLGLLARHIGEIRGESGVQDALSRLALVPAEDGEFRAARGLYLKSPEMVSVFGSTPELYADASLSSFLGVEDTLRWLGVSDVPRPDDLLARVDEVCEMKPALAQPAAQALFEGLARLWPALVGVSRSLTDLRSKNWLPAVDATALQVPTKVFTVFSAHLFRSQALFLNVPQPVQVIAQQAPGQGQSSLVVFLGIQGQPSCSQVVAHLLHEAAKNQPVNAAVYTFLDQHSDDPSIAKLCDQACLLTTEHGYIRPAQALQSGHGFGNLRHRLGADWLRLPQLLAAVGVPAEVGPAEAYAVLVEVAQRYDRRQLSEDEIAINAYCWGLLTGTIEDREDWRSELIRLDVVPSATRFLRRPGGVYFEDRPGLADKFDDEVRNWTIRRPEVGWVAMYAVGVRNLSDVVRVRVVNCDDPQRSDEWNRLLDERWPLVRRVMASRQEKAPDRPPEVWAAASLKVSYELDERITAAEDTAAVWDAESNRLYVEYAHRGARAALARELAFLLVKDSAAGLLAAALKEVLTEGSADDAAAALRDLGFADVVLEVASGATCEVPEAGLGVSYEPDVQLAAGDETAPSEEIEEGENYSWGESDAVEVGGTLGAEGKGDGRRKGSSVGGWRADKPRSPRTSKFVGKSFVQAPNESGESVPDGIGNEHRLDVDRRGTEVVCRYENAQRRDPRKMEHFNKGYDVESFTAGGSFSRYIEIKSLSGPWDLSNVGLSVAQFQFAREQGARFWLYVVDKLDSGRPDLYMIQDPASKVSEYRFDDGWVKAAESAAAPERGPLLTARSSARDTATTGSKGTA